jgi:hypothetical protein
MEAVPLQLLGSRLALPKWGSAVMVCTSVLRNKNATMTDAPELSVVDDGGLLPSPKNRRVSCCLVVSGPPYLNRGLPKISSCVYHHDNCS